MSRNITVQEWEHGKLRFGGTALNERPQLATFIAEIIATWAQVEVNLGTALAAIADSNSSAIMTIYSSINGFHGQKTALQSAAKSILNNEDYLFVVDMLNAVNSVAMTRHHFAHWAWASISSLPDDLLLIEPKHLWVKRGSAIDQLRDNQVIPSREDMRTVNREDVKVWRKSDFETAKLEMNHAQNLSLAMALYFVNPDLRKPETRQTICSHPFLSSVVNKRMNRSGS